MINHLDHLDGLTDRVFMFKGLVESIDGLPKDAELGDVLQVRTLDTTFLYTGEEWEPLSYNDSNNYNVDSNEDWVALKCKSCGAPLKIIGHKTAGCEHCGTLYQKMKIVM